MKQSTSEKGEEGEGSRWEVLARHRAELVIEAGHQSSEPRGSEAFLEAAKQTRRKMARVGVTVN